ncbi:MAG TPA: pitrilysin family protein [Ignavibacteria bacterium]|nr:pitrilysin family protein [Ignavibacteria bacterium]
MPNGLKVVAVPYNSPGIASFFVVVRVGSRNEVEEGVTGFAHFFEHIMFRGTDKYPKEKYEEVLKSIGASANANTSLDRTIYHMTGNAEKLELMFEIESDRFKNLNYSEHDFKTEAGAIKGEYTKNFANPGSQLYELIQDKAFDKHTYKHTTMGFFKDIVDMPNQFEYSKLFYKRFYRPEYCTILVVGDVKPEKVYSLSQKYFGNWMEGDYEPVIPVEPVQTETRYAHIQNSSVPPVLTLNFKSPAFSDKDISTAALEIISSIAFSERSDINKKLVLDEKKVRYIYCSPAGSRDPDLTTISASVKKAEDLQYVKDEIMKTLEDLKVNPISDKLLNDAKSNIKYSFAMSIDNPNSIANAIAFYIYVTGNPESVNNYYSVLDKITPEDIMKTAQDIFKTTGLTIGTITSEENSNIK